MLGEMIWRTALALAALAMAIADPARAQMAGFTIERSVDRAGSDYESVAGIPLEACAARCRADARCAAFVYVLPQSRCWLKTAAPPPRPNNCCISGVKASSDDVRLPDGPGTVEEP